MYIEQERYAHTRQQLCMCVVYCALSTCELCMCVYLFSTLSHSVSRTHMRALSSSSSFTPIEQDGYTREQCEVLGKSFYSAKQGVGNKNWGIYKCVCIYIYIYIYIHV